MAIAVSAPIARVILKRGREGPVRGGNPWIFSQAIDRIEPPSPEAGALVAVHDAAGALIGMGYCNPATTIAIRMLAWGETPAIDELVARRLKSALGSAGSDSSATTPMRTGSSTATATDCRASSSIDSATCSSCKS